jgi:hypothetical protein
MKYFYSPSVGGFFIEGINSIIPEDAFEISQEEHQALLDGQSSGKSIVYKSRKLQLVEPEKVSKTWDDIRARRDRILANCDWTQMADSPLSDQTKTKWATYRQKLRDLTETYSDPNKVVWPVSPSEEA